LDALGVKSKKVFKMCITGHTARSDLAVLWYCNAQKYNSMSSYLIVPYRLKTLPLLLLLLLLLRYSYITVYCGIHERIASVFHCRQ